MKESYYDVTIEAKVRKTIRVKANGQDDAEVRARGLFSVSDVDKDESYDERVIGSSEVESPAIFVVAWEYEGGGGFDWYLDRAKALLAFEEEKKNADKYAENKWCAFFFETTTLKKDNVEITHEIAEEVDDRIKNPEFFYSKNSKLVRAKSKRRGRRAAH